jgi:tetratricopeptide (TPR) repeat protein
MYNWRADMELKLDGASNAIICHQRARELLKKVLAVKPDNSWARHSLGGHWHNEGNALKLLGRREEAIAAYQQAIVEQQRAFEQLSENNNCRQFLSNHHLMLGRVLRELGRPLQACAAFVEASRLWPNDPKRLYDFAAELTLTATLIGEERAERSGYLDQAFALLRQAVARGYKDARQLQENQALAELRKRPEFQELLTGLSNSDR